MCAILYEEVLSVNAWGSALNTLQFMHVIIVFYLIDIIDEKNIMNCFLL